MPRERDPGERAAFLEQVCAGDESLRQEVESLLAEDAGVHSFLETPALEFVRNMSGEQHSPPRRGGVARARASRPPLRGGGMSYA